MLKIVNFDEEINTSSDFEISSLFDAIFVITLERCKERQEWVSKQLKNLGVDFSFYYGVDADVIKKADIISNGCGKFLRSKGEIGCALSHYNLWKLCKEKGLSKVLILEDDITVLPKSQKDFIQYYAKLSFRLDRFAFRDNWIL